MLVVADSSPINVLIRIDHVDMLPRLFGSVLIPPEVQAELSHTRTPITVRTFALSPPSWVEVRSATSIESIPPLDPGEEAAISLAREVKADALLIDEKDGRRAAAARSIPIIGTLGLLERAALNNLIQLPEAINRLKATDFRIDARLIQEALKRDAQRR